jgi:chromosome segregation ATPase
MEILQEKSYINHLNTQQYIEQINSLKEQTIFILDDFKKLYVINKMHPENGEYQYQYENVVSNINKNLSSLFTTYNDIQSNTNDLNKKLTELNISIEKEKKRNIELKKKLGIIEHTNNSSTIMIHDYKEMYNKYYLQNWSIVLSTLLCIYTISVVYKKQKV